MKEFCESSQQVLFSRKVFDPNSNRYLQTALPQCHIQNEKEKKRTSNNRVLQIEQGSFTPLLFLIYVGMSWECRTFYTRLAKLIADKRDINYSVAINWVRNKLSFALLKTFLLCLRGSRSLNKNISTVEDDIKIFTETSRIAQNWLGEQ